MKILHLLSNWKWTERSEPAVDLAVAEAELGANIRFVCGQSPPDTKYDAAFHAAQKGIDKVDVFDMPKHFKARSAVRDVSSLRKLLASYRPDIIHCHLPNAHLMAALAKGMSKGPLIIASNYDPEGRPDDFKTILLYRYATDGLVVINQKARDHLLKRAKSGPERVLVAEPGIDLDRFAPTRKISGSRVSFGLEKESFVVGLVSRIRESRRIDIVLVAIKKLAENFPQLRMLLIGRGSKGAVETAVVNPARRGGIADRIILAGYCRGDRLVAAYRSMDILIYPVPGTDKTCRTVREAMAAGIPVIAPQIGFLPELIKDGHNGRLMKLSGERLARILCEFIKDETGLQKMSQHALETAQVRFSRRLQAQRVLSFCEALLKEGRH